MLIQLVAIWSNPSHQTPPTVLCSSALTLPIPGSLPIRYFDLIVLVPIVSDPPPLLGRLLPVAPLSSEYDFLHANITKP